MILSIYQRFTARASEKLPLFVLLLCIMQPFLDVASYFLNVAGSSTTLTLALRLLLLCGMVLVGFLLSERKWIYWCVAGMLVLFTAGHVLVCMYEGYVDPLEDLTNLIRIYQLPLTALAFITFLRRCPECLEAIKKGCFLCLMIIIVVEILSVVTDTNPYTYSTKSIGIIGWFYTGNAQSAIISMLAPVAIAYVLEKKQYHPLATAGIALLAFGTLYLFATRLSYAALLGTAVAMALTMVILKKTQKVRSLRAAGVFLLCAALAVCLYSVSPMAKNTAAVAENLELKQQNIDALVAQDDAAAQSAGLEGTQRKAAALQSVYDEYLPGLVGRFGLERVAQWYDYTTDASIISDVRLEKLNYCRMLFEDSGIGTKLFGTELSSMYFEQWNHDVENDFHGIYYLCGGVGLCLMVLFFLWFIVRIIVSLVRDFSAVYTVTAAGFGVALITAMAHAYFTSGVLRRPNVTFYLAVVLAAIYALTQDHMKKKTQAEGEPSDIRKDDGN